MSTTTKLEITSFNKGFITEANGLNFPDGAALVDSNFVLNRDGSRQRRLGLQYEPSHLNRSSSSNVNGDSFPSQACSIHLWKNPCKTGEFDIIIMQISNHLYFYRNDRTSITGNAVNGGGYITLPSDYAEEKKINIASLTGFALVAYGAPAVAVLEYNVGTDTVTLTRTEIKCRDLFGVDDGIAVDYRPALTTLLVGATYITQWTQNLANHDYNLRNQGWPVSATATDLGGTITPVTIDPTRNIGAASGWTLPSNADVFSRGRISAATRTDAIESYSGQQLLKISAGTSPAPKGACIMNVFERSRDRQLFYNNIMLGAPVPPPLDPATIALPTDTSAGYISSVGSYAGRFFYTLKETSLSGGDKLTPKISTMLFFSQVVKSIDSLSKCYTDAAPTDEFLFNPVATDGGFITIPDAGEMYKVAQLGVSLFVFAKNGVWEIYGTDSGFSAQGYNVSKVTDIGALSAESVLSSEGVLSYISSIGIHMITVDQVTGRGTAVNLTAPTIQTFFDQIPTSEKARIIGAYEESRKRLRWIFALGEQENPKQFTSELVFDIDLKAFHLNEFYTARNTAPFSPRVLGLVSSPSMKYLVGFGYGVTNLEVGIAEMANTDFEDFGLDAVSTLTSGPLTGQAGSLQKQTPTFVAHFQRTETGYVTNEEGGLDYISPSGCIVTPMWSWSDLPASGKWGQPFQAYKLLRPYIPIGTGDSFLYGQTVITTKSKLRGRGAAVSFQFQSEPGKDLHLLGWGLEVRVAQNY